MFIVCARNCHIYTHLILALSIVSEPTIRGFMTSTYACTHAIGRATRRYSTYLAHLLVEAAVDLLLGGEGTFEVLLTS